VRRQRPVTAVIVPAYGFGPHLPAVLSALGIQTLRPDHIVVSHSGSDGAMEAVARDFPGVGVLHSPARLFAGDARNRGAGAVHCELLAFCDSDVLPAPDWLENLVATLIAHEGSFAVGSVGMAETGGYWGRVNWLFEFSELAPWRRGGSQHGGGSGNMAVWKRDFDAAGGFPPGVRVGEDTLLFRRLRALGREQIFVPSARVGHFNMRGVAAMARHQRLHGRHFASTRRSTDLPGSAAVRTPLLAGLLPAAKAGRVLGRLLAGGTRQKASVLLYFPGVIVAAMCWGFGLMEGLRAPAARPGH
jgi:hypothetical protein